MVSVSSGGSKSMLSFTIYVGIGSKSHVLVVDVRTMRVMSFLVAGVTFMHCAYTQNSTVVVQRQIVQC